MPVTPRSMLDDAAVAPSATVVDSLRLVLLVAYLQSELYARAAAR